MNESHSFQNVARPLLLQFTAKWCGPCKMLTPIVNLVEPKIKEFADVKRIDVDEENNLGAEFSIRAIPTLILLDKDGSISWRHTGMVSESELIRQIEFLK